MSSRRELKKIFLKSIDAVHPPKLIRKHVFLNGNKLTVYNQQYEVNNNCYIVGFGKAVYEMSQELEKVLGEHLVRGCVSIPHGTLNTDEISGRVAYIPGAVNNLPDREAEQAAKIIVDIVSPLTETDLLFVLISGGGSALLPAPVASIPLEDKTKLIKMLGNNGASIIELNCVRKKLSTLKGGGLARLAHPAKVVSLILSDVIGDPLDFIASGPTVPNTDDDEKFQEIIGTYVETSSIPQSIQEFLDSTEKIPKKDIPIIEGNYHNVTNFLIGNNWLALSAAENEAKTFGWDAVVLSNCVSGDVDLIGRAYSSIALEILLQLDTRSTKTKVKEKLNKYKDLLKIPEEGIHKVLAKLSANNDVPICLIFGGEPTVQVKGNGKGGRNQHLALLFAKHFDRKYHKYDVGTPMNITFFSGGTDGIDGPTDAAGAISFNNLTKTDLNFEDFLDRNDSYNFFSQYQNGKFLIKTGHTGTNVMDVHLILINIL